MIIGIDASRANKPIKTGVEWYSYHLIQAIKILDNENRYFLYTDKVLSGELARCPSNFQQVLLKWPPVRFWTLIRLSLTMKSDHHRPHTLFIPAHTIPLLTPSKTVVTVHDIGFERFPELYKWADILYHKWTIRFIRKHSSQIITISEFSKQELIDVYHIPADKISVIYNGYNQSVYRLITERDCQAEIKAKFNLDSPYFMFLGRLDAKKNITRLVQAFGEFKKKHPDDNHKLVLVGKKGYRYQATEMMVDNYRLAGRVVQSDWLPEPDVALLLNGASLFIFPSLYEGFGIPVIEAMACGVPVICSNTSSLPEVAGEAAIKFNPENIDAIVKAIETVIYNPEIARAMVEQGLAQAKKFSWRQCAEQTLKVLIH